MLFMIFSRFIPIGEVTMHTTNQKQQFDWAAANSVKNNHPFIPWPEDGFVFQVPAVKYINPQQWQFTGYVQVRRDHNNNCLFDKFSLQQATAFSLFHQGGLFNNLSCYERIN